jgi:tetraacyldisaccharide 4'-kinase
MRAPAFWNAPPGVVAGLLAPAALAWTIGARLRRRAAPLPSGVPVICVGNLVVGGAGKTPVVRSLATALRGAGIEAQVLLRGHGGRLAGPVRVDPAVHRAGDVGDEALLHARTAPVWVARDRGAGARAAAAGGARMLVLDDGFQNPQPAKDLSLLVVDGATGFGNGRVMPAGPLREPIADGLARADAVVIMGDDVAGVARTIGGRRPILHARVEPAGDFASFSGRRVLAFAGIGRPAKFFGTLAAIGAIVVDAVAFADHHPFTPDEVMRLVEAAHAADAILVTTEKDAVRLPDGAAAMVRTLSVAVRWDDPAAMAQCLQPLLADGQALAL